MAVVKIPECKLRKIGMETLQGLGVSERDAGICLDVFLFGSYRGLETHGFFALLPRMVKEIRAGRILTEKGLVVSRRNGASLFMDGEWGLGPVTAFKSMEGAIGLAREKGIGCVCTRHCNHFGAASFYGFQAVKENLIGATFTNASPRVVPYGGRRGVHGTNPMSFVVPAGKYAPMAVDIATSASSAGKISETQKKGGSIPEGWAVDSEGRSTTNPEKALAGFLLPMADHKGYGLALVVDILTGALAGSYCGTEFPLVNDMTKPYGSSMFMMAINPELFVGLEAFQAKVEGLIEDCVECPPADGFDRVCYPGQMEAEEESRRREEGIPVREGEVENFIRILRQEQVEISIDQLLG